ncbi:MAG: LemA family protein [Deltaproteobacteria bacterium]|nr:LemA family protein [Deltaproteobacteria bacterium]
MSKGAIGCGLLGALLLLLVATAIGSHNRLVGLDERVEDAWSQVEDVYQRRADLAFDLVATVEGATDPETLASVVEARGKVGQLNLETAPDASQLGQFEAAQRELSSALGRLLAGLRRDPELAQREHVRQLQVQLEGIEDRIAVERERFNDTTLSYNKTRRRFPTVLLAFVTGLGVRPYFEPTKERNQPGVEP